MLLRTCQLKNGRTEIQVTIVTLLMVCLPAYSGMALGAEDTMLSILRPFLIVRGGNIVLD